MNMQGRNVELHSQQISVCAKRAGRRARVHWSRSIVSMQQFAIVVLIAAAPALAFGKQTEGDDRATDESFLIKMMNAETRALDDYARCLEDHGIATPCAPPRPLQLPPTREPPQEHGAHGEAMLDSAARALGDAEIRAIKAHANCVRSKQAELCGPSP